MRVPAAQAVPSLEVNLASTELRGGSERFAFVGVAGSAPPPAST